MGEITFRKRGPKHTQKSAYTQVGIILGEAKLRVGGYKTEGSLGTHAVCRRRLRCCCRKSLPLPSPTCADHRQLLSWPIGESEKALEPEGQCIAPGRCSSTPNSAGRPPHSKNKIPVGFRSTSHLSPTITEDGLEKTQQAGVQGFSKIIPHSWSNKTNRRRI